MKRYRIVTSYSKFYVQEFIPEKRFLWFFVTQKAEWESIDNKNTEEEAMVIVRRLQKYDNHNTIW
jgi:CRISPR/Cas system-associated exonuclease Cas4 (RecB family)